MLTERSACYVGIGSNLNDPLRQVRKAFEALRELPQSTLVKQSSLYGSRPMGPLDQADYVNAAVMLRTGLQPLQMLAHLKEIETRFGRDRKTVRWGPRVIDLDILLFGDLEIVSGQLTIPHPGMLERAFVVRPLLEIEPRLELPGGGLLSGRCARFAPHATWIVGLPAALPVAQELQDSI